MARFKKDYLILFTPLVLISIVLTEWVLWIWTPYSFFYSRGSHAPNIDYQATTYGDLSPEDIFITPKPREARYVTDQFGARNSQNYENVDILIMGESFGTGAGNGHELTPAYQLSKYTNLSVAVSPSAGYEPFLDTSLLERITFVIETSKPISCKIILIMFSDNFFWDWDLEKDNFETYKKNIHDKTSNQTFFEHADKNFNKFKTYLSNYSPITILARKLKSSFKSVVKRILVQIGIYPLVQSDEDIFEQYNPGTYYYDKDGTVYGFRTLAEEAYDSKTLSLKLQSIVEIFEHVYKLGLEKNVILLPVMVPEKTVAYSRHISNLQLNLEYPGQKFEEMLQSRSIPFVSIYGDLLQAIDNEMQNNGEPIYWSDGTHWNEYGIEIAMRKVTERLDDFALSQHLNK